MKKVIIYGVSHKFLRMRRLIERFLDDNYKIIGYSDGHYPCDIQDHKLFFKPEDICKQSADFIIINTKTSSSQKDIRRNLLALGIPAEKIISPVLFLDKDLSSLAPLDLVSAIEKEYQGETGLIFGMSYSANGIFQENLTSPFYNCSWNSLDLYYNFKMYEYQLAHNIFSDIQTAWLVLPYYYFDFDLSKTSTTTLTHSALWRLDDWHNFPNVPNSMDYIENFRMFSRKLNEFFQVLRFTDANSKIISNPDYSMMLAPLWFTDYPETVTENKEIFIEFLRKLKEQSTNTILIIPPFYLKGLNGVSKSAFQTKKEKFYRILQELEPLTGKIPIFDYSDRYAAKRDYFYDLTHLNFTGAEAFTDLLNKEILQNPTSPLA